MKQETIENKIIECLNEADIDYIIVGEADYTFFDLLDCLEKKKDVKKIKGIAFKDKKAKKIQEKLSFFPVKRYAASFLSGNSNQFPIVCKI
jgi:radical SAM superfamily enzyme YgiQ (UPF0313 family)